MLFCAAGLGSAVASFFVRTKLASREDTGSGLSVRALVVGLFGFRRKQLGRALRELTGWDAARVRDIVASIGLPVTVRPEGLSPQEFVQLHRALVDGGWRSA
jgi:16S rRNA A1518/A1519 N6-dimethyltransferase RsmA/KsgA/DIM1 with predicted DNA glycosylase/AP lyase activity